jgi:hypothetical protein
MSSAKLSSSTLAFAGLLTLHKIGGAATAAAWQDAFGHDVTSEKFHINVTSVLLADGLVNQSVGYVITREGFDALGRKATGKYVEPAPIVPPRTVPAFSPRQRSSRGVIVYRSGALDYRDHPSLVGGERIPYRSDR